MKSTAMQLPFSHFIFWRDANQQLYSLCSSSWWNNSISNSIKS